MVVRFMPQVASTVEPRGRGQDFQKGAGGELFCLPCIPLASLLLLSMLEQNLVSCCSCWFWP